MSLADRLQENGSFNIYYKENQNNINIENKIIKMNINDLKVIIDQPFKEYKNSQKYELLKQSIKATGINTPLIIREISNEDKKEYYILSGRHRYFVAKELNLTTVPCIIKSNISNDEAKLILLDSNLCQRDELLPSEKAFSYKQKLDIMKRQGKRNDLLNNSQNIRSDDKLSKELNIDKNIIHQYIKLVYLIPELLNKVDDKKISLIAGYHLAFIKKEEQVIVNNILNQHKIKPTIKMVKSIKDLSLKSIDTLDEQIIKDILLKNNVQEDNNKTTIKISKNSTFNVICDNYLSDYINSNDDIEKSISIIQLALKEYFSKDKKTTDTN